MCGRLCCKLGLPVWVLRLDPIHLGDVKGSGCIRLPRLSIRRFHATRVFINIMSLIMFSTLFVKASAESSLVKRTTAALPFPLLSQTSPCKVATIILSGSESRRQSTSRPRSFSLAKRFWSQDSSRTTLLVTCLALSRNFRYPGHQREGRWMVLNWTTSGKHSVHLLINPFSTCMQYRTTISSPREQHTLQIRHDGKGCSFRSRRLKHVDSVCWYKFLRCYVQVPRSPEESTDIDWSRHDQDSLPYVAG